MQGKDKISQLKDSILAKKDAEARKQASGAAGVSPGMKQQYHQKIGELEAALEKALNDSEGLKKKAGEAHENFLRKHAEFENFRKRMEREKSDVAKYGHENMAKEILPVLDSLEKAIEHADESHEFQHLLDGVQLVLKQLLQALEKFGLFPVEAKGQEFNPHVHEAVGHHESEEHPPNFVVEEHRRGYKIHDRLLRPAMVSVAKPRKEKDQGPGTSDQGPDRNKKGP